MPNGKLKLECVGCGAAYQPPQLHCEQCSGLLRSHYDATEFRPSQRQNLFSFQDWLPPTQTSDLPIGTRIFSSAKLGQRLGLRQLFIAFSGYAPTIGAGNPTGSFKDFEATPTLLYYREHGIHSLVLASAGNTARAFAYAAIQHAFPVIIVIPEKAMERLWIPCEPTGAIRLVVVEGCDDYAEAIRIAGEIGRVLGVANEGGARNVARRDGMSTAILEYAKVVGDLPDHYFQAVGSGTGAIATWEASERLISAGAASKLPRLHLSQNAPFTPIHNAWALGQAIKPEVDVARQLRHIAKIDARVLANRMPPYAIPGGVRDALASTEGQTYAIANSQAKAASELFLRTEGLAIGPAAAVATASLIEAATSQRVAKNDAIMLHITGNNDALLRRDVPLHRLDPAWRVRAEAVTDDSIRAAQPRLVGFR